MKLHAADIKTISPEIFGVFDSQNALLTAGSGERRNTMTIGWCQLGELWGVPACTVFVRPERYTYEFMEENDYFTVSVLPAQAREVMRLCGSKSGREVDKIAACGLTVCRGAGNAPFFEEAELVLVCKKLYVQDLDDAHVVDGGPIRRFYGSAAGSWHRMYIGEVVEAYTK